MRRSLGNTSVLPQRSTSGTVAVGFGAVLWKSAMCPAARGDIEPTTSAADICVSGRTTCAWLLRRTGLLARLVRGTDEQPRCGERPYRDPLHDKQLLIEERVPGDHRCAE